MGVKDGFYKEITFKLKFTQQRSSTCKYQGEAFQAEGRISTKAVGWEGAYSGTGTKTEQVPWLCMEGEQGVRRTWRDEWVIDLIDEGLSTLALLLFEPG